jgi:hypothetical protein
MSGRLRLFSLAQSLTFAEASKRCHTIWLGDQSKIGLETVLTRHQFGNVNCTRILQSYYALLIVFAYTFVTP